MSAVIRAIIIAAAITLDVQAADIVLKGARWAGPRVMRDVIIVIRSNNTATIGRRANMRIPRHAVIIDATDRWVAPGYVDNHVHVSWKTPNPDAWSRAGVTTLVDNGSTESPSLLRAQFASGPRVAACGPIITIRGGYPITVDKRAPALEVADASEAARQTANYIEREKPDCIKVAVERGFRADLDEDGWPALDRGQIQAIVRTAHTYKLSVHAHVTQLEEFKLAVAAGVDVIAHSPIQRMSDDALREAASRDVVIVSTVGIWADPELRDAATENLVRYVRLGGRIAIGSDYPNWKRAGLPMTELRILKAAGLSNAELMDALTRDTTSRKGFSNSFVVLKSDPLKSLDAFADVMMVVRNGKVVFLAEPLN